MSHISFSELKEWAQCPWKHKLVYLEKIKQFQGNEYTAFGTALHTICEHLVQKEAAGNLKDYDPHKHFQEEFLKNLQSLHAKVPEYQLNAQLVGSMRTQGDYIIQYILPSLKKYFGVFDLVGVEEELYVPISAQEKNFKGFIDLIVYTPDDNKYHIIDWKTCSWGWDNRKKTEKLLTYQLTLYKHFWCKKHQKNYGDVLTHFALLKRTAKKNNVEIFKVSNGNKKIENALKLLNKALYNITKKNYIKNKLSCHHRYGTCEFYKTEHCK
ncbi:MAG: hypothetical protein GOVbin630_113 [Prokaryotic dsDNA virus sp.]|nr:MAG: hypothetical protein GOVbin630_113 [Prokaryotic dsDNA virus sp.]|tara:strand:- start:11367 stop:12170 length:804 start_codon:yes stop_codon:yes gene_type:complete